MNAISFVYAFLLFFLLTPGILVVLPKKGKTLVVAGVHAVIFSLVFVFTNHWLMKNTHFMSEGFKEGAKRKKSENKLTGLANKGPKTALQKKQSAKGNKQPAKK